MASFLAAVLPGILLPFVISAALWPFLAGPSEDRRRIWLGAPALAVAYLAGHVAINGAPELAPAESSQWLFHLVAAAGLLGALEAALDLRFAARLALRAPLVAALLWLTVRPLVEHSWSIEQSALRLSLLAVATLLLLFSADTLGRRGPAPLQAAIWTSIAGAGGAVLLLCGSARLAEMSGALAAALLPVVALLWWRGAGGLPAGVMTPAVVTFIGVWLNGVLYTEMPAVSSLAVAAAPFAAWSGETRWAHSGPRRRLLVAALAVALLLAVALAGAIAESLRTAASDPYYH